MMTEGHVVTSSRDSLRVRRDALLAEKNDIEPGKSALKENVVSLETTFCEEYSERSGAGAAAEAAGDAEVCDKLVLFM